MAAAWESERSCLFAEIWGVFNRGELVPCCAWCGRVRVGEAWFFPPAGALDAIDARLSTSHSLCPTCAQTVSASGSQHADASAGSTESSGSSNPRRDNGHRLADAAADATELGEKAQERFSAPVTPLVTR